MLQLLRSRRWIGFTVLVLAVIVAFGLLSRWQWHRAAEKRAQEATIEAATRATPLAVAAEAAPTQWQPVSVTGVYDGSAQVVVRKRPLDATNGFWVLAPLRLPDGTVVWVNRGWIPAVGAATAMPTIPAPPGGTVTVRGWWRAFEPGDVDVSGLPVGMVPQPAPAYLPLPGDFSGYVQRIESTPNDTEPIPIPRDVLDDSRNVSYAIQWILFAIVAVVGWFIFLRREAREDREMKGDHVA